MKPSRVLERIGRGEVSLGIVLHLADPCLFEMASLMGFDAIWIDMEHHAHSLETAAGLMRAARVGGTDIIARPAKGEFMRISRLLEIGASGVMYPRCESADEAAEVVKWAKFAPLGRRGFDGAGADASYLLMPMGEYLREANRRTYVIIQLEDPAAVEQADAIAAVDGVDMLMLGPADFSILSGIAGQFDHPSVAAAIRRVATAALRAGKPWCATCGSLEQARAMIDLGAKLVFHGCDLLFVKAGLDRLQATFAAELGIRFGDDGSQPRTGNPAAQPQSYLAGSD